MSRTGNSAGICSRLLLKSVAAFKINTSTFIACLLVATGYALGPSASAQEVRQAWVQRYSLNPAGTNQTLGMALAPDGNLVVAGTSTGTNGDADYVAIKYAPNGMPLWTTRYASPSNGVDQLRGMAADPNGNVLLTGTSKSVNVAPNGNVLWSAPYGGRAVAADSNYVYVTGFSEVDWATAKLNAMNGSNVWTRTEDVIGRVDISQRVALDKSGNVYVAGFESWIYDSGLAYRWFALRKYSSEGVLIWRTHSDAVGEMKATASALATDVADNVYLMGGYPHGAGDEIGDAFITFKFTTSGAGVWRYNPGDPISTTSGRGEALLVDSAGSVYLTGSFSSGIFGTTRNYGYLTARASADGSPLWRAEYQAQAPEVAGIHRGMALALDAAGNVYVTGYSPFLGTSNDIATIKYDSNGNQLWLERYNGPANRDDYGTGIAVDAAGNVYVTGYSTTTNGSTEFVTIKYSQGPFIERRLDGSVQLRFQSAPGGACVLEASTNLQAWQPLATNIVATNGLTEFLDTNATTFRARFYRGQGVQ